MRRQRRRHVARSGCTNRVRVSDVRERPPTVAVDLDGPPGEIVAGHEGVWVTVDLGGHGSRTVRIDPATNRVAAIVPVPGDVFRIAAGDGAVWVAGSLNRTEDVLHRIDPETRRVVATVTFPGSYVGPLAVGDGAVWLVLTDRETRSGSLARIDPDTNEVALTIPLDPGRARYAFDEVAVGQGAVWVLALEGLDAPGDLIRVDPDMGRVAGRIRADALNMGVGPGGVWITGCVDCDEYRDTYFAQEVDTGAGAPTGPRIAVDEVGFSPLYVGEESVWFSAYGNRGSRTIVFRLDPRTRTIERCLRLGDFIHTGMAFDLNRTAIWVARVAPPAVLRVDL